MISFGINKLITTHIQTITFQVFKHFVLGSFAAKTQLTSSCMIKTVSIPGRIVAHFKSSFLNSERQLFIHFYLYKPRYKDCKKNVENVK